MRTIINLQLLGVVLLATSWTTNGFAPNNHARLAVSPRQQQQQQPTFASSMISNRIFPTSTTTTTWMSTADNDDASGDDDDDAAKKEDVKEEIDVVPTELESMPTTRVQRFRKKYFSKPDDGLTFKQRMAKAGLSVALSYGWVSNVSYSVTVSLAWYIFNKRTGLSPLAPGQWKGFLAVYAGFYVFNNIIRPVRFGLSVGVSAYFDRAIKKIQDVFKVNKGVAIFLTVFFANVVGTCTLMALGISLASLASGVPIFVPKA